MNEIRRLIVRLQNLASKARDAVALDEIEKTKRALSVAKMKATTAILDNTRTKASEAAGPVWRRRS